MINSPKTNEKVKYKKLCKIGYGSYGYVYKVEENEGGKLYALKKFFLDNLKNDKTNFVERQFKLLKNLHCKYIAEVIEYLVVKDNECLVFNYYELDLLKIINNKNKLIDEEITREILRQILEGVLYLHENNILHRDLKPDNILISEDGFVKITDFDLAREIDLTKPMSRGVATIYYRAPEIFYGDTKYSFSLDIWSVGCILAELILREPLFKGRNEIDVLFKIQEIIGSPNEDDWPGCTEYPNFVSFGDNKPKNPLDKILEGKVSDLCLDLLKKLLVLDPKKRPSARNALNHEFFNLQNSDNELLRKYLNLN